MLKPEIDPHLAQSHQAGGPIYKWKKSASF